MSIVLIHKSELEEIIRDAALRGAEIAIRKMPKDRPTQYRKADAARELNISRPTLDRMIAAGNVRLNKAGMISAEEIDRVISCQKAV